MMMIGFFCFFSGFSVSFSACQHSSYAQASGADSGGLMDEEVRAVVMIFPFKTKDHPLPLLRSNDDDDEFWDVSGHYLTERKEAGKQYSSGLHSPC